jgi:hypothetical protein
VTRILPAFLAWAFLCAFVPLAAGAEDNKPMGDAIGAIEGESIAVDGPMSVEVVHGQVKTVLRSGSDVRVKVGQARIELIEGGTIVICGPAHFSVLKSGGSLTVALDTGTIHAHLENELALTIYTPQIQAHPLSIGGGAQDFLVGLDAAGTMCIRASKGAVRVEQQLTGQSMLVPQSGDVSLANGQLESLRTVSGQCACELTQLPVASASTEVSKLATTEEIQKKATEKKPATVPAPPPPGATEKPEPVYQVFMPPLQYDAKAKVQAAYDPNLIVLVRRVRVRPTLIFQGKVEGETVVAQATTPTPITVPKPASSVQKPPEDNTWSKVKAYFQKIW